MAPKTVADPPRSRLVGKKRAAPEDSGQEPVPPQQLPDAVPEVRQVKRPRVKVVQGYDLFTFGTGEFGQLGHGEDVDEKLLPAQLLEGTKFTQVACGGMHTAAISTTGEVWTWGVNDEGALGRPTFSAECWSSSPDAGKQDPAIPGKAALPPGRKAVQVAAGDGFTLVVADDGSIYGCGFFKDDQGSKRSFSAELEIAKTFTLVYQPASTRDAVSKLAAGNLHAAALTRRGDVLTFGIGAQGQLGRINRFNSTEGEPDLNITRKPLPVPVGHVLGSAPADVVCGSFTTYVIGENGNVAGWGLNNSRQLGFKDEVDATGLSEAEVKRKEEEANFVWHPVFIDLLKPSRTGLGKVVGLAGGEYHNLVVIRKAGHSRLHAFGSNLYGALGVSEFPQNSSAGIPGLHRVEQLPDKDVMAVDAGNALSACITVDGHLYVWGLNAAKQMGRKDSGEEQHFPQKINRNAEFGWRKVHQVSFGGQHVAILTGRKPESKPEDM